MTMRYGQFCPLAKATEVLGERWTLLVVRELLAGATRYGELKRALGRVSPSVLSARLKALCDHGVIERVTPEAGGAPEYRLTSAGAELAPIVEGIGGWGQRWVRSRMTRDELDVELLMLHVTRQLDTQAFPLERGVVAFVFTDLHGPLRRFWLLIDAGHTELCATPLGRAVDATVTATVRTLAEAFNGDTSVRAAIDDERLVVEGAPKLVRSASRWLRQSPFAGTPSARVE
jgi:DNA-binding HxlR family transcriptional regulator